MRGVNDLSWSRRGLTLLWGAAGLDHIVKPPQVLSIRQMFALSRAWPDELPAAEGNALVVAGVEGCLDTLSPGDASEWLEQDLRRVFLDFQDRYQNQAAMVFWIPGGKKRITMPRATEQYEWHCAGTAAGTSLPLGRCLWAGAEDEVRRILNPNEANLDLDGPGWIGLNHPRIS